MAFKRDSDWFPEDDGDEGFNHLDDHLQMAFMCALDYVVRHRHRLFTVEHLLLLLVDYSDVTRALGEHEAWNVKDALRVHLQHVIPRFLPKEGVEPKWSRCLDRAVTQAAMLVYPYHATVLDMVHAIFKERSTFGAEVLRNHGLTSKKLEQAVSKLKRKAP